MKRARNPTPSDHRRFDRLLWGPGGVYEDYRAQGWHGSIADLLYTKYHRFVSYGHEWELAFSVWFLTRSLQATISLCPTPLLSPSQTPRIEASGFYDFFAAFFRLLGYERGWVTPRGNIQYTRTLHRISEVGQLVTQFLDLDLGKKDPRSAPKSTPGDPQKHFREFLRWGRRQRSKGWRVSFVELRNTTKESSTGVSWRIRKDLLVGPTNSCSWFFAWPPRSFTLRDWNRLEKSGFFRQTTDQLLKLGQKGYWRPGLFTDPDRLAAEFWKPEHDPKITRKDFRALLDWRLPSL